MYNLTENQQEILRWIVKKVREGNLSEEFSFVYLGSGDIKFRGRGIKDVSDHPYISQGILSALKESNLLLFDRNEQGNIHCTLLGKAYDAVDSNFDTINITNNIKEMQRMRFQFLQKLYEVTEGNELVSVNLEELGDELGFTRLESDKIDDFLSSEGLIKHIAFGGTIVITHNGVSEVESALSKPDNPTAHFPSVNYNIHVEQMIGSQIQQGNNQSSQILTYTNNDLEEILKFVSDLKSKLLELKLDTNIQAEVESEIGTLESQIKSPRPKFAVIKECLMSLRTILEGMAGNVIASLLVQQISNLP